MTQFSANIDDMSFIKRKITPVLKNTLERNKSVLLLGPRQTGKTTLIDTLSHDRQISFADPRLRQRYEKEPGLIIDEVNAMKMKMPLIVIDEVQKVPEIIDAAQYLIDKKQAQFILTGSSARKLKRHNDINLLPGRVIPTYLDALMIDELPKQSYDINSLLMHGSLPEIIVSKNDEEKENLLEAYVITYLEEEVRSEALVRNLAHFSRFLELAAAESGYVINSNKLSQDIGIAASTISAYYQILEDCLIINRIEPITKSKTRHRLSKAQKYLFFDLGVRRLAAQEGTQPPAKFWGHLFEQFIGLELIKLARLQTKRTHIRYWKDLNGPEVDWVIEQEKKLTPIEVKWADTVNKHDAKHLQLFLQEYPQAKQGFVICDTPQPIQLTDNILAIPWQHINTVFDIT